MNKSLKMLLAGVAIAAVSASVYARGGDCRYGGGSMMGAMKSEPHGEDARGDVPPT